MEGLHTLGKPYSLKHIKICGGDDDNEIYQRHQLVIINLEIPRSFDERKHPRGSF